MPEAILLGGAGFIGLHLAHSLLADRWHVTLVDDLSRARPDPELQDVLAAGAELIAGDMTERATLARLPETAEQVYLLAAVVGVRNVERDPYRVMRVNALTVLNAVSWLPPAARLFFASTSEVYSGGVMAGVAPVPTPEGVPLTVPDTATPRFAYACSKLAGEATVIHGARARGFEAVIGRFHNVYGPRMGASHVIPELSLRALRREDPFTVFGVNQTRAFCYVSDAVLAMRRVMGASGREPRIVHIGNDLEETRIGDLAQRILALADHDPVIQPAPAPPGSVPRRCPDIGLLRRLTGFEPRVSLADGLAETFAWYRDRWVTDRYAV